MDSLITAAGRALAAGDPLGALKRVALRDDAPALALRGIAMGQLGDFVRAKALLRRAGRAFGPKEALARARCVVAEAEVALASRDLGWPERALHAARATLETQGDRVNAAYARYLDVRRLILIGRLDEAEMQLAERDPLPVPAALTAARELVVAGIAMRRLRARSARTALARAGDAARQAGIPALAAEVESASAVLDMPAARLIARGVERPILLDGVEALLASDTLVVDAGRRVVRDSHAVVSLARRPVLFALARALGEAWPADVTRDRLIALAFGGKQADESHRARLRVEVFQIAGDRIRKIDPRTGQVLASIPAPGGGGDSGLAWAEGTLWVGQYRERKIHQIDPETGTILRTVESNRFVTGVTWTDGELWHGTLDGEGSELRQIDPRTGEVLDSLEMPPGADVSGLESDAGDQFFCGGGSSGKVRVVRRPRRGSTAGS